MYMTYTVHKMISFFSPTGLHLNQLLQLVPTMGPDSDFSGHNWDSSDVSICVLSAVDIHSVELHGYVT